MDGLVSNFANRVLDSDNPEQEIKEIIHEISEVPDAFFQSKALKNLGLSEDQADGLFSLQEYSGNDLIAKLKLFDEGQANEIIQEYKQNIEDLKQQKQKPSPSPKTTEGNPVSKTNEPVEPTEPSPEISQITLSYNPNKLMSDSSIGDASLKIIAEVQENLVTTGHLQEGSFTKGTYDQATKEAIESFQRFINVNPDGKVYFSPDNRGGNTFYALKEKAEQAREAEQAQPLSQDKVSATQPEASPDSETDVESAEPDQPEDQARSLSPKEKHRASVINLVLTKGVLPEGEENRGLEYTDSPYYSLLKPIDERIGEVSGAMAAKLEPKGFLGFITAAMTRKAAGEQAKIAEPEGLKEYHDKASEAINQLVTQLSESLAAGTDAPFSTMSRMLENIETKEELFAYMFNLPGGEQKVAEMKSKFSQLDQAAEKLGLTVNQPLASQMLGVIKGLDYEKLQEEYDATLAIQEQEISAFNDNAQQIQQAQSLTEENNQAATDYSRLLADKAKKDAENKRRQIYEARRQDAELDPLNSFLQAIIGIFQGLAGEGFGAMFQGFGEAIKDTFNQVTGNDSSQQEQPPQDIPLAQNQIDKINKFGEEFAKQNFAILSYSMVNDKIMSNYNGQYQDLAAFYNARPNARSIIEGRITQEFPNIGEIGKSAINKYMSENNAGYRDVIADLSSENSVIKDSIKAELNGLLNEKMTNLLNNEIIPDLEEAGAVGLSFQEAIPGPSTQQAYASYSEDMLEELQSRRQQNGTPS
jgi:hypothetical protein